MPQISILIENKYHTETLDDPLLPQPAHQGGPGALHPHHQHLQCPIWSNTCKKISPIKYDDWRMTLTTRTAKYFYP